PAAISFSISIPIPAPALLAPFAFGSGLHFFLDAHFLQGGLARELQATLVVDQDQLDRDDVPDLADFLDVLDVPFAELADVAEPLDAGHDLHEAAEVLDGNDLELL